VYEVKKFTKGEAQYGNCKERRRKKKAAPKKAAKKGAKKR